MATSDSYIARRTAVDPKAYLANERTFLHWVGSSVTLGAIAAAYAGLSAKSSYPLEVQ